jgi:hypothetical protein
MERRKEYTIGKYLWCNRDRALDLIPDSEHDSIICQLLGAMCQLVLVAALDGRRLQHNQSFNSFIAIFLWCLYLAHIRDNLSLQNEGTVLEITSNFLKREIPTFVIDSLLIGFPFVPFILAYSSISFKQMFFCFTCKCQTIQLYKFTRIPTNIKSLFSRLTTSQTSQGRQGVHLPSLFSP